MLRVSVQFLELVSSQPGYLTTVVGGLTVVIDDVEYEGRVVVGQKEVLLYHRFKEEGVAGGGQDNVYRMQLSRVRCWKMAYLVRGWIGRCVGRGSKKGSASLVDS